MSSIFNFESSSGKPNSFFKDMHYKIESLSDTEREEFEERAAIMEHEGLLSHEEAEWRALRIVLAHRVRMAV